MAKNLKNRFDANKLKDDTIARELVSSEENATRNSRLPVPSSNPATNLVIAEVLFRALSILARNEVEKRVAKASYGDEERAKEVLGGRTIISTLALYGVGKVAARSKKGFGVVAAGLVGKALYDRGRTLQRRRRGR